ncbi:hypothetical protein VPH35_065782 [Triticum aestivum]
MRRWTRPVPSPQRSSFLPCSYLVSPLSPSLYFGPGAPCHGAPCPPARLCFDPAGNETLAISRDRIRPPRHPVPSGPAGPPSSVPSLADAMPHLRLGNASVPSLTEPLARARPALLPPATCSPTPPQAAPPSQDDRAKYSAASPRGVDLLLAPLSSFSASPARSLH